MCQVTNGFGFNIFFLDGSSDLVIKLQRICGLAYPYSPRSIDKALRDFLTFITQVKTSDQHNNHAPDFTIPGHSEVALLMHLGPRSHGE